MSFYYINVDSITELKRCEKYEFEKIRSPANDTLLQTAEAIRKLKKI